MRTKLSTETLRAFMQEAVTPYDIGDLREGSHTSKYESLQHLCSTLAVGEYVVILVCGSLTYAVLRACTSLIKRRPGDRHYSCVSLSDDLVRVTRVA